MTYSASGAPATTVSRHGMLRSSSITRGSSARPIAAADQLARALERGGARDLARQDALRERDGLQRSARPPRRCRAPRPTTGCARATTPLTVIGRTPSTKDSMMVWPVSLASTPWTRRSSTAPRPPRSRRRRQRRTCRHTRPNEAYRMPLASLARAALLMVVEVAGRGVVARRRRRRARRRRPARRRRACGRPRSRRRRARGAARRPRRRRRRGSSPGWVATRIRRAAASTTRPCGSSSWPGSRPAPRATRRRRASGATARGRARSPARSDGTRPTPST